MKVGIVGAGAVGCYVAGALGTTGKVTLVGRARQRASIQAEGLTIVSLAGERRRASPDSISFTTDLGDVEACDVVLVAVKSGQTDEVGRGLAGVVSPQTLVVSLQNGVRNPTVLRAHLPNVAAAIVSFNVVLQEDETARQTTSGPLMIENVAGSVLADLVTELRSAAIETEVSAKIAAQQWAKLVINLSNAISALSGVPTKEMIATPGYRAVIAGATEEALSVLSAANIEVASMRGVPLRFMATALGLPTFIVRLVVASRMKVDPRARSSMWQDLNRRRLTEVDDLNGEIVRLGDAHGREAPVNAALVRLVHEAEEAGLGSPNFAPDVLRAKVGLSTAR